MKASAACLVALMIPEVVPAAERVAATNTYTRHEERWEFDDGRVYWRQDNVGTYEVTEGPLEDGASRCVGSGFGGPAGVSGGGICIYQSEEGSFTMEWTVHGDRPNTWRIVASSGIYAGMVGSGTSVSRVENRHVLMPLRSSDWQGEIERMGED